MVELVPALTSSTIIILLQEGGRRGITTCIKICINGRKLKISAEVWQVSMGLRMELVRPIRAHLGVLTPLTATNKIGWIHDRQDVPGFALLRAWAVVRFWPSEGRWIPGCPGEDRYWDHQAIKYLSYGLTPLVLSRVWTTTPKKDSYSQNLLGAAIDLRLARLPLRLKSTPASIYKILGRNQVPHAQHSRQRIVQCPVNPTIPP